MVTDRKRGVKRVFETEEDGEMTCWKYACKTAIERNEKALSGTVCRGRKAECGKQMSKENLSDRRSITDSKTGKLLNSHEMKR